MFKRFVFSLCLVSASANFAIAADPVTATSQVASQATGKAVASTITKAQQAWLSATIPQRVKLAEEIGESGARQFAKSKGWSSLFSGVGRTLPQGPDQVYRATDGIVHVIEAKGGSSSLGHAYGHPQGSANWAVESAKRVANSPAASAAERSAANQVIQAAAKGNLEVHVVRTRHILGQPTVAVLEQSVRSTDDTARLAKQMLPSTTQSTSTTAKAAGNAVDDVVVASSRTSSKVLRGLSRAAIPVAATVDVGFRANDAMKTEQAFQDGKITQQERETAHTMNTAGMVGGWGGAITGAKLGAAGGGVAGAPFAGVGAPIGAGIGGVAGGVTGYFAGEAAAESATEWTMDKVHRSGNTISGAASSVKRKAIGAWNYVW